MKSILIYTCGQHDQYRRVEYTPLHYFVCDVCHPNMSKAGKVLVWTRAEIERLQNVQNAVLRMAVVEARSGEEVYEPSTKP